MCSTKFETASYSYTGRRQSRNKQIVGWNAKDENNDKKVVYEQEKGLAKYDKSGPLHKKWKNDRICQES